VSDTGTIVLATSARRPEYRRDFLTCVASPEDHPVSFSYLAKWFDPDLLDRRVDLAGRRALVVFCDEPADETRDFDFLALRHAHLLELRPAELIKRGKLTPKTPITVVFQLGRFIHATDAELPGLRGEWNATLRALPHRPRPVGHPDEDRARFVFGLGDLREGEAVTESQTSWRALSEALGGCRTLANAFFLRVGKLRKYEPNRVGVPVESRRAGVLPLVYPVKTNTEYELELDAYMKSGETPFTDAITAASSSDKLVVQTTLPPNAGRATEARVMIRTAAVQAPEIASLTVQGASTFEHDVARVQLVARVEPSYRAVVLLMLLIAVGAVMAGASKDDFGLSAGLAYAIKFLGGVIVAGAGYVALRRAPGISGS
jgi:hypothetical protein